jgi:peptidyl-prolyl cis-trans isomerase SurA
MQSLLSPSAPLLFRVVVPLGLAALTLTATACRGRSGGGAASASPDTWATVDGRAITRAQVENVFRQNQDPNAKVSPEEAMTLKLSILNELILQDILIAKAQALKVEVPQSELDAAFNERKQNLTDEQFQEELKKRSLTSDDMREGLRRELLSKKLIDQEVVAKVAVSDQEVTDFYNANKAQFTIPEESYRLAQIVVTPDRSPQPTNRTGNDATTPQEATFKVRMITERIKSGARFADVAMDYSEDPDTAQRGGDLGLVPVSALNRAPEELRKAVIGKQPGTISVATSNGVYTIVAIVAHEQAGERTLSTPGVKDAITQTLKNRKEQLLRTAYLSAARGEADVVNYAARRVVDSQGKVTQ